ncbi:MAG: hypothetical protein K2Q20_08385, partial [Phycisphaerales bacterium]|nr:hypothetical protein [Phycisphaerales bacterium]
MPHPPAHPPSLGTLLSAPLAVSPLATTEAAGMDSRLPMLRITTCGSVDDGKSTLIGRLLL